MGLVTRTRPHSYELTSNCQTSCCTPALRTYSCTPCSFRIANSTHRIQIAVTGYVVNLTGHDDIRPEGQWANPEDPRVRLKPVFENGVILRQHTFEQVRARARACSEAHRE